VDIGPRRERVSEAGDNLPGMSIDYVKPGPFTSLDGIDPAVFAGVPDDPIGICRVANGLVVHPMDIGDAPDGEKQIRPAARILEAALARDPQKIEIARPQATRVVGTCRNYATLAVALLRRQHIPARARCGFGTYFEAGKGIDHWIAEFRDGGRWVRVDVQWLTSTLVERPDDLAPGEFLTGGEAWAEFRAGRVDASRYGVPGTEHAWGPGEIRGNAIRDLAALNNVETLPWDEWGRMDESYQGRTGPDYDARIDELAGVCASDDGPAVAALYESDEFRVPAELIA
jgi:hypothetical protein